MAERDLPAPGELVVYTDGGCIGNPGPGGWGALLLRSDGYEEIGGREERTTNNRMEMRAAVEALRRARSGERVHVLTDSRYLQDGISKWIRGWKKRGWKKADGGDVLNRDLWEELDALVSRPGLRVSWEHVRGHSGHLLNERCDQIANGFARGTPPVLERWDEAPGAAPNPGSPEPALGDDLAYPAYLSWAHGELEAHATWPECAARVKGAKGARHQKVRGPAEFQQALASWGLTTRKRP